jgi:hypothetical protein
MLVFISTPHQAAMLTLIFEDGEVYGVKGGEEGYEADYAGNAFNEQI